MRNLLAFVAWSKHDARQRGSVRFWTFGHCCFGFSFNVDTCAFKIHDKWPDMVKTFEWNWIKIETHWNEAVCPSWTVKLRGGTKWKIPFESSCAVMMTVMFDVTITFPVQCKHSIKMTSKHHYYQPSLSSLTSSLPRTILGLPLSISTSV